MSTSGNKTLPGIMGLFAKTKTPEQALVEVGALATKLKRKPPVLLLEDDPEKKKQSPRLVKFSASVSPFARVKTPERTTTRLAGPRKVEANAT